MNERAWVVLSRIALTSFMYGVLLKACAFLNAIEGIGDETHWRSAIEGSYLVGARDVVAAQYLSNIRTAPGSLDDDI
jgi:hypothetical protein